MSSSFQIHSITSSQVFIRFQPHFIRFQAFFIRFQSILPVFRHFSFVFSQFSPFQPLFSRFHSFFVRFQLILLIFSHISFNFTILAVCNGLSWVSNLKIHIKWVCLHFGMKIVKKGAVSHLKMVKKELSANLIDRLTNQDNCISIDRWFPYFCRVPKSGSNGVCSAFHAIYCV